nr:hypothetical protein [Tanacetum cinerariifolium]
MAQHRTSYLLVLLVIVLCIAPRWTSVQADLCCQENDMISCDPDNAQDRKKCYDFCIKNCGNPEGGHCRAKPLKKCHCKC